MDLQALLEEPGADAPFTGLPAGAVMGHVQLEVTDAGLLSTPGDVQELAQHLAAVGRPHEVDAGALSVRDLSGNLLRFAAREG